MWVMMIAATEATVAATIAVATILAMADLPKASVPTVVRLIRLWLMAVAPLQLVRVVECDGEGDVVGDRGDDDDYDDVCAYDEYPGDVVDDDSDGRRCCWRV